jgi:hypothetical protein
VRTLLPGDETVDMDIVHFEEFNQLLGKYSGDDKYEGAYEDIGQFILRTPSCIPAEADRLLRRILACLLVGNTDAHLKNFAMFHARDGLRLTPAYDLVAASFYQPIDRFERRRGRNYGHWITASQTSPAYGTEFRSKRGRACQRGGAARQTPADGIGGA